MKNLSRLVTECSNFRKVRYRSICFPHRTKEASRISCEDDFLPRALQAAHLHFFLFRCFLIRYSVGIKPSFFAPSCQQNESLKFGASAWTLNQLVAMVSAQQQQHKFNRHNQDNTQKIPTSYTMSSNSIQLAHL